MSITIQNICKRYGKYHALDGVSLEARDGQLLALLGPSGSGKTTLLRIIAGLEIPDSGQILFREADVTEQSARDRNIGFVFQHYALFRHMTVFENIAFGLRVRNALEPEIRTRVGELLHLIRLDEMGHRYPSQLSGGQRQRVALARALAPRPHILLLDEPFGALDARVRQELRAALRKLHRELRVTTIFVTHDQEEAFDVADEVVVMNQGRVEQAGSPREVSQNPANDFVKGFLANVNVPPNVSALPRDMNIVRQPGTPGSLPARIVRMESVDGITRVRLSNDGFGLAIDVDLPEARAKDLDLRLDEDVFVFPRQTDASAQ